MLAELQAMVGADRAVERLLSLMRRQVYAPQEYLIRQGDEADTIYFVESGQVTAQLETTEKAPVRLETMGSGRLVGELGFCLNIKRTAAVIADEPSVIYALSRSELTALEKVDAEAFQLFYSIILHILGERVVHLIRTVEALEQ